VGTSFPSDFPSCFDPELDVVFNLKSKPSFDASSPMGTFLSTDLRPLFLKVMTITAAAMSNPSSVAPTTITSRITEIVLEVLEFIAESVATLETNDGEGETEDDSELLRVLVELEPAVNIGVELTTRIGVLDCDWLTGPLGDALDVANRLGDNDLVDESDADTDRLDDRLVDNDSDDVNEIDGVRVGVRDEVSDLEDVRDLEDVLDGVLDADTACRSRDVGRKASLDAICNPVVAGQVKPEAVPPTCMISSIPITAKYRTDMGCRRTEGRCPGFH
jgi:hypothetical protein